MVYLVADADRASLGSNTNVADIDIVIARGERGTGIKAQPDVVAAAGVVKRVLADGRIGEAVGVVKESLKPARGIIVASRVRRKRACSRGGIVAACGIVEESTVPE